ncbi:MAG: hypothetical protein ACC657_13770 [Thiohalomonadales bacterium]
MNKIVLLISLSLLFSCSDDSSVETTSCTKNTSNDKNLTANSIQVLVESGELNQPLAGVTVQLDSNGLCLVTDEKGVVRFDGLNSNKHDIHVFGNPGYEWKSEYSIDSSSGKELFFSINKFNFNPGTSNNNYSYININGAIINSRSDSTIRFSKVSDISNISSFPDGAGVNSNATAYDISYEYDRAEGTSITTELWAFEKNKNATGDRVLVDAVRIPKFTTVTTKQTGSATTHEIKFQPQQTKPQASQLLSFGSINYPVGLTFSDVSIGGYFKSTDIPNRIHHIWLFYRSSNASLPKTLTSSDIIEAYSTPLNITNLTVQIDAQAGENGETRWMYSTNKYLFNTRGINITPKITNVPLIISNQKGNKISWSSAPVPLSSQFISISQIFNESVVQWNIQIHSNISQISLPQLPNSVKPMLKPGTKYNVYLSGRYQADNIGVEYEYEEFSTYNNWTR